MIVLLRVAALGFVTCALSGAENWTGWLVNARCYESVKHNVSPQDSLIYVDRDRGEEILYCSPNTKTKTFTIVDRDGSKVDLDTNGNTQGAYLVLKAGKRTHYVVTITGERQKGVIKVNSIVLNRQVSK